MASENLPTTENQMEAKMEHEMGAWYYSGPCVYIRVQGLEVQSSGAIKGSKDKIQSNHARHHRPLQHVCPW